MSNVIHRIPLADVSTPDDAIHQASPTYIMADGWLAAAVSLIELGGTIARASLISVKGSAPREVGAMMLITADDIYQTIGGGTLEYEVMATARKWISAGDTGEATGEASWQRRVISVALGPDMGQCCGGHVRVLLELFTMAERGALAALAASAPALIAHPLGSGAPLNAVIAGDMQPGLLADGTAFIAPPAPRQRPLFLYGAGHVGRALVGHLAALEFDVHWVDIAAERFPAESAKSVCRVIASDPTIIARHAPVGAVHLVLTHNHALDQAICHTVLQQGDFARLGLIGSATKAARFRRALAKAGIGADFLDRLVCPIGMSEITGKQPARVALSIAAGVALWQQEMDAQTGPQNTTDIETSNEVRRKA